MADVTPEVRRVITALENAEYDWRTVQGIVKETGLSESRVRAILTEYPDLIMQSSIPDKDGRPLFTTRAHYRQTHGAFERLKTIFRAG
jgi:hypothetical protein